MRGVVKLAPRSPGSFTGICPRRAGALDVILLVLDAQAANETPGKKPPAPSVKVRPGRKRR